MGAPIPGDNDPRIDEADALFAAGRFEEARLAYGHLLVSYPEHSRIWRRLGEIALLSNHLDEAQRRLKHALELAPDNREAATLLAESHFRRDEFTEAAALLRFHGLPASRAAGFEGERPYAGLPYPEPVRLDFLATDPLPLVSLRLNGGVERAFLIDTGGPELIVDTEAAREIGLEPAAESTGTFAADMTAPVLHGKLDVLALGSLELRDVPVTISPIRRFSHLFDRTVDGVLGTVIFYHFLAEMDYPGGRLTLWPKTPASLELFEREVAAGTRISVPFWLAADHIIVAPGQVNDGPRTLLFLDTGLAGNGFTCPESTVNEAHVRLIHEATTETAFPGGTVAITPMVVDRLRLGEAEEWEVQGLFGPFPPSLEHSHGFRIGGLISHTFFKPYDVVFDFTGMRLLLKRQEDHLPTPEARR